MIGQQKKNSVVYAIILMSIIVFVIWWIVLFISNGNSIPFVHHQISVFGYPYSQIIWFIGIIVPLWWVSVDVKAQKVKRSLLYWIGLSIVVFIFVYFGARFLSYGFWGREWFQWTNFWDFSKGGSVLYGGLFGSFIGGYLFLKIVREKEILKIADLIAPSMALTLFVMRLANCFFVGDDFGTSSTLPWAISYPSNGPYIYLRYQTLHPAQIYLSLGNLLIFIALLEVRYKKRFNGQVFAAYCMLYTVMRFFLEFFRDTTESKASALTHLTYSQMLSIGLLIFGLAIYYFARKKFLQKQKTPATQPS